ncbi:uncharacterized protein LOC129752925 [Uranotaenia lowii]|uniref:uncharacterized protein LOC129752925 n=1 Tax=Uranotaenia lowii TaxID=190385 RepID=UPI0024784DA7|nr:uncharacterized protein LOC129752925 [Uranotaenia lowii]
MKQEADIIRIYEYYPFTAEYCGNVEPITFFKIQKNISDISSFNLFPDRLRNFYNCTLKVGTFEIKPFIIIKSTPCEPIVSVEGIEARLIQLIARKLNFRINYVLPPDNKQWGYIGPNNSISLMKMIQEKEVDFGIGSIAFTKSRHEYLKVGVAHHTTKVVIAIPDGRSYTAVEKLIRPFDDSVWCALLFVIFIAIIVIMCIQHFQLQTSLLGRHPTLSIFEVMFGISQKSLPQNNVPRILLFTWMYYCFVIRNVYQGLMFSILQEDPHKPPLENIDEVLSEGLYFYMNNVARRFFLNMPEVQDRIIDLPNQKDNLLHALSELATHRLHGVVVVPIDNIAYFNRHNAKLGMVHCLKQAIATYPIGVHYPKNSPLTKSFDALFESLLTSGISYHWAKNYGNYDFLKSKKYSSNNNEPAPLNNSHLIGCYLIYVGLLLISLIVFVCEQVIYKLMVHQHFKKQQKEFAKFKNHHIAFCH